MLGKLEAPLEQKLIFRVIKKVIKIYPWTGMKFGIKEKMKPDVLWAS